MPKKGLAFQEAVADIVASFDSVRDVSHEDWVMGPYGRRDRDVTFTGIVGAKEYRVLIECKDYDPQRTGKVGIDAVDQLESKRQDIKVDLAIICSNAGFTKPALLKAWDVGIPVIAALKMGDDRIKFEVTDTIYIRKITVPTESLHLDLVFPINMPKQLLEDHGGISVTTFEGCALENWLAKKIGSMLNVNPIVNSRVARVHHFKEPLRFQTNQGDVVAAALKWDFSLTGAWYRHRATINTSTGLYDWTRKRVRGGTKDGRQSSWNLDSRTSAGKLVVRPPEYVLRPPPLIPAEFDIRLMMLHGPIATGPAPPLDQHLVPSDQNDAIEGSPESAFTSTPGYKYPAE